MKARTLIKVAVSCGLIGLILARVSLSELVDSLLAFHLGLLTLAVVLSVPLLLLKMYKWHRLLKNDDPGITFKSAALSLLCGLGVGLVTPGRAGEVTRAFFVRSDGRSRLVGLVIVDRLLDLIPVILCAAVGVAFFLDVWLGFLLAACTMVAIYVLYDAKRLSRWLKGATNRMSLGRRLSDVISSLDTLNRRVLSEVLLLTAAIFLGALVQFYLLLSGLTQVSPMAAVVSFPLLTLASVLPITISGLGTREGAAALILSQYGVTETAAINAAFLSFCLNTLVPGLIGTLLISTARLPSSNGQERPPDMLNSFEEP